MCPSSSAATGSVFTEVWWATMHGLATLARGGRIPVGAQEQRVAMLVEQHTAAR